MYNTKKTIRYMGNKSKLLDFIVPELLALTNTGDVICELMAGTNSVTYALKEHRCVYSNDVQFYSFVIANAIIKNNSQTVDSSAAKKELLKHYDFNIASKQFSFFEDYYANTYFSQAQCAQIDSIRYAIEQITNENRKNLYLVALMYAMCNCQSTSGHFAQYLPQSHPRLEKIKERNIWDIFVKKCDDFSDLVFSNFKNESYNMEYTEFINTKAFDRVDLVYIDPPYTGEQYSRFYHILETVCKYDSPDLEYKGLYRKDRFTSAFSLRKKAFDEFDKLLTLLSVKNKKAVISYSTKGMLKDFELEHLVKKHYVNCEVKRIKYHHSTQGKGNIDLEELLFIAYN